MPGSRGVQGGPAYPVYLVNSAVGGAAPEVQVTNTVTVTHEDNDIWYVDQRVTDVWNVNANLRINNVDNSINNPVYFRDTWTPTLQADETDNDSDKLFTVPASTEWQLDTIWVEYVSTATAGDRQLVVQFQDSSGDVIGEIRAGAVQAASLTRNYMFGVTLGDLTAFRDTDWLMTPLPPMILGAGFKVRVYDKAAVAAAADDMNVQMMVIART